MNYLDFTVNTYEILKKRRDDGMIDEEASVDNRKGRKRNLRTGYLDQHPKHLTHDRIARSEDHTYMPNVIGQWFPRRDVEEDEDFYFASILVFLRPWRDMRRLKQEHRTWKEEGLRFLETATTGERDVIAGMQYYYDSKAAAEHEDDDVDVEMSNDESDGTVLVDSEEAAGDDRTVSLVTL